MGGSLVSLAVGRRRSRITIGIFFLLYLGCAFGCQSAQGWKPSADLERFDSVVVEDFGSAESAVGEDFAKRLAAQLEESGLFSSVLREGPLRDAALVVEGEILSYKRGNVALRMKLGRGAGEARLDMRVAFRASDTGEILGFLEVEDSTFHVGPDARRTGRETGEWLLKRAAESVVAALQARLETP